MRKMKRIKVSKRTVIAVLLHIVVFIRYAYTLDIYTH